MNCRLASSTSRASVDLPEPLTPVTATRRCSGRSTVDVLQVVQRRAADRQQRVARALARSVAAVTGATARRACSGCTSGCARKRPVTESAFADSSARAALGHQPAAALAGARADVDDVVGAADRVLVVLDHDQRVALVAQLLQRVEQDLVVARVQADGRLVEHVADALQVAAELRREADALRLAARERRRGAVERQVAEADFLEELEPAPDLGDHVARDLGVAAGERQRLDPLARVGHRPLRDPGDRLAVEGDLARDRVQARAGAVGAGLVDHAFDLGSSDGKLCSRPWSSSSRIESS